MAVVAVHLYQIFILRGVTLSWARSGDVGVYVFFVLSGYLISASVLAPARFDRRGYLIRRAARILPLYYLSMLVGLVFIDPSSMLSKDGRFDILTHVFMLHGLSRGMRYSINGVWWTLSIEALFYVFMAVFAGVFRHRLWGWCIASAMVFCGLAWRAVVFVRADTQDFPYFLQQLPGTADLFGIGMLLALSLRQPGVQRVLREGWARRGIALVSVPLLLALLGLYHQRRLIVFTSRFMVIVWPLALSVALAGVLAVLVTGSGHAHLLARWSGLAFLGTLSYGIYLFHPFVALPLLRAWSQPGRVLSVWPFALVLVASSVAVAATFHYSVERPLMRWGRQRAGPRS